MDSLKNDFSIFKNHPNLVYLDNASTTQTPDAVLSAVQEYYTDYRSNVHRGMYPLSQAATEQYESARRTIAEYLNAEPEEIIFTSGTTMGLNMLQKSLTSFFGEGDNIVLTRCEHHVNLIPWQMMTKKYGGELRFLSGVIPSGTERGDMRSRDPLGQELEKLIDERTKIVSIAHASHVLGSLFPVEKIIACAKEVGAITILDGAQTAAHMPIDVKKLECDFYVFSGHKMYGPTGIGVVYGRKELLQKMKPVMYGGEMIEKVTYDSATWAESPHKFEAGTPNIADAIGMAAAVQYVRNIGWTYIQEHEKGITTYLLERLQSEVNVVGAVLPEDRVGIVSFNIPGVHPHDAADILGKNEICVRAGHHCAMPLMNYLGIHGTLRASIGVYTTRHDIDRLVEGVHKVKSIFHI
jgi:cysteine desulfurase / selenocysteine lyase